MPRGDGTGPAGQGPMTGRGMGFCAGYSTPGYANSSFGYGRGVGYGWGRGLGRGMGWRRWTAPAAYQPVYPQQVAPADEKKALQEQSELLKKEQRVLQDRIAELEKVQKEQKDQK